MQTNKPICATLYSITQWESRSDIDNCIAIGKFLSFPIPFVCAETNKQVAKVGVAVGSKTKTVYGTQTQTKDFPFKITYF